MPKKNSNLLTDLQIKRIQFELSDRMFNDGGGLYLYARKNRSKEWIFRYSSPLTNKRRKITLGSYPDISLKEARDLAIPKRALLDKKIDPLELIQQDNRAENEARKHQTNEQSPTIAEVFYRWLDEDFKNQKNKGKETKRMFIKDVLPTIGLKPINEVTRQDVKDVLQRPLDRGANRVANMMLTDLKRFFNYAEDEDLLLKNPARRLTKDRVGGKTKRRKRVLSKSELILLNKKLPHAKLKQEYIHLVWLFLATGCRRNELIQAPLSHFDIDERNFTITPDRAKNTDAHNIYLSDFALYHLQAIKKLTRHPQWLIPDQYRDEPLDEGAITKFIRMRQPRLPPKNPNPKWRPDTSRAHNRTLELLDGHWTTHDLRRTSATIMQDEGIMPHIIKKCLNQRVNDPIMETYQRSELKEDQKQAFLKLGEYLATIYQVED